jgi:serpin B
MAPFQRLDGSAVDIPMMHGSGRRYAAGDGWQAAELTYIGGPSMLVVVPDGGRFSEIEGRLDADFVAAIDNEMDTYLLDLHLPRWETDKRFDVIPALESLGVDLLFDRYGANLSGIADIEQLYISDVLHQANITVDEQGTEAAAATAAVVEAVSAPPPASLRVDRPFIYFIRGGQNGEILFMGRFLEP